MSPSRISLGEIGILKKSSPIWSYKSKEKTIRRMKTTKREIMCIVIEFQENSSLCLVLSDSGEFCFTSDNPIYWKTL